MTLSTRLRWLPLAGPPTCLPVGACRREGTAAPPATAAAPPTSAVPAPARGSGVDTLLGAAGAIDVGVEAGDGNHPAHRTGVAPDGPAQ